jgi:hypothetical protein
MITAATDSSSEPSPRLGWPLFTRDDSSTDAIAARVPLITYTSVRTRRTLMPASRAADSSPPIA